MDIPMIEIFLPNPKAHQWEAICAPINSIDKIEWFEDISDWPTVKVAHVKINNMTKECDVF